MARAGDDSPLAPLDDAPALGSLLRRFGPAGAVIAILLLAIGLRVYGIDRKSLWLDEGYTLALSTGRTLDGGLPADTLIDPPPARLTGLEGAAPIWRVMTSTEKINTHPPVYFALLRLWRELFGEGDVAARSFSLVCSVLAAALLFDVGRLLRNNATGLWAALLLAVAVPQVTYGQEARNYAIQLVFALIAAGILLRVERHGAGWLRLCALAASFLLLVLTHYFGVAVAAALGVYAVLQLRGPARRRTLGAMAVAGVLFLVLWGPSMWAQRPAMAVGADQNPWFFDAQPGRAWRALRDALQIPARLMYHSTDGEQPGRIAYAGALLYVLSLLLWRRRPDLRLPTLWVCFAVAIALLLDIVRSSIHLTYIRYTLLAGPGVYLLIAGLLAPMRGLRHLPPALAMVACVLTLPAEYNGAYVDWRRPADYLREHARPGDVILSSAEGGYGFEAHSQMLFLSHYLGEMSGPIVVAPQRPSDRLIEELRASGRRVWLVTPHAGTDPATLLPGARLVDNYSERGAVELWLLEWPAEGTPLAPR